MSEQQWFDLNEFQESEQEIQFVIMVAQFQEKHVIVYNNKRRGWEFPGGSREPGESPLTAAARELYEETGAIQFMLEPFGIYQLNGSYGMVYSANITQFNTLSLEVSNHEIGALKLVDTLPEGMSFGDMFYSLLQRWTLYSAKGTSQHFMDLALLLNKN